ncbi:hypothetical protein V2J09_011510 [Rumex salicifolius]
MGRTVVGCAMGRKRFGQRQKDILRLLIGRAPTSFHLLEPKHCTAEILLLVEGCESHLSLLMDLNTVRACSTIPEMAKASSKML